MIYSVQPLKDVYAYSDKIIDISRLTKLCEDRNFNNQTVEIGVESTQIESLSLSVESTTNRKVFQFKFCQ